MYELISPQPLSLAYTNFSFITIIVLHFYCIEYENVLLFRFDEFSAIYIQNWWKKHREKVRESAPPPPAYVHAPQIIPQPISVKPSRPRRHLTDRMAATIIQKSWRRHIVSTLSFDLINLI